MTTKVLNPFTIDAEKHSLAHGHSNDEPSMTVQADSEAADINNIVKKFGVTGMLPYGDLQPVYDDFTQFPTDYHEAMNIVRSADSAFMDLPANVRASFNNDAGLFLNAVTDPSQYERFRDLGLVPPKPVESPPPGGSEPPVQQPKGASSSPAGDGTVST